MRTSEHGRPNMRTERSKEIAAYHGYWSIDQCKNRCEERVGCYEFRVKKNPGYSGCVLYKEGTEYSGRMENAYTTLKLANCSKKRDILRKFVSSVLRDLV